jgi:hypothetical protein
MRTRIAVRARSPAHLRARDAEEPEIRDCGHAARSQVHHRGMGNVAIGKHDYVDAFTLDHFFQIVFFHDGNRRDSRVMPKPVGSGGQQCREFAWR